MARRLTRRTKRIFSKRGSVIRLHAPKILLTTVLLRSTIAVKSVDEELVYMSNEPDVPPRDLKLVGNDY